MTIAVLALQGAFAEHEKMIRSLGADCIELRQAEDYEPHGEAVEPNARFDGIGAEDQAAHDAQRKPRERNGDGENANLAEHTDIIRLKNRAAL